MGIIFRRFSPGEVCPGRDPRIGRLVLTGNFFDLTTTGNPIGVTLNGTAAKAVIDQLVIRQNQIRHADGVSGPSSTIGITLKNIANAIVEENAIYIGDPTQLNPRLALQRDSTVKMKTFNNRFTGNVFLPCFNTSTSTSDDDLVSDVEVGFLVL